MKILFRLVSFGLICALIGIGMVIAAPNTDNAAKDSMSRLGSPPATTVTAATAGYNFSSSTITTATTNADTHRSVATSPADMFNFNLNAISTTLGAATIRPPITVNFALTSSKLSSLNDDQRAVDNAAITTNRPTYDRRINSVQETTGPPATRAQDL